MVAQRNFIKKVEIEVNTRSNSLGMHLKDKLDAFFKEQIFPEIDGYFSSIQKNDSKIIRIDTILIDINFEEKSSLDELKSLIISQLKQKINYENILDKKPGDFTIISTEQNEIEAFFHFLKNGLLPWWFDSKNNFEDSVLKQLKTEKEISKKLKVFFSKPQIRKRLINQFDDRQLFKITSIYLNTLKEENFKGKIPPQYRLQFWEALLNYSIFENKKHVEKIFQNIPLKDVLKMLEISAKTFGLKIPLNENNFQEIKSKDKISEKIEKENEGLDQNNSKDKIVTDRDGILIKNAGLILLHPFLKTFFEKLDFLAGRLIKAEKIDEAIHILHYLATGRERVYEYELLFEKFLCNVPIHKSINRHITISKEQKIACEVLLQAVLEHWSALKSTSTKIIQNEFFQREGKLIISEEKQSLIVERKAPDILLDKLPWNIHLIKIPWREKILFVEW